MKTKVRAAATILATGLVLWVLVRRFGGGIALGEVARGASPRWVGVAFLVASVCVLLGTERWRLVLFAMGYRVSFRRALEAVLATWPLALVTPSRANDLLRALAVRDVVPVAAGTGSVLAEKVIDLFVLLIYAAAGAASQGLWAWAAGTTALAVVEVAGVWLVAARRSWLERLPLLRGRSQTIDSEGESAGVLSARRPIEQLFGAYVALRGAPGQIVGLVAISFVIRVLTVGITHALLVSVGADVSLFDTTTLWPVAILVGLAPVTLAGIGTRDAAFIQLLAERGARAESAQVLAATVGYSIVAIASFAVVGLPFMIREMNRMRRV